MRKLIFRPTAETDLAEIFDYIADRSSPTIAIGYVRRIRRWCDQLLAFPESGRRRDDLRPGVRILAFERRVVIAYMVLPQGDVEVGRVFYGGRDYEALIERSYS